MKLFCVPLLLLLLAACSSAPAQGAGTEDPADFDLRTDRTAYLAEPTTAFFYGFSLTAELENTTADTLYLDLCYPDDTSPIFGIPLAESEEESAWSPVWACVGHSENIVLEPGQVRSDTYQLEGPTVSQNAQPLGMMEGLFRLTYRARPCPADEQCAATDLVSNAFRIELAR